MCRPYLASLAYENPFIRIYTRRIFICAAARLEKIVSRGNYPSRILLFDNNFRTKCQKNGAFSAVESSRKAHPHDATNTESTFLLDLRFLSRFPNPAKMPTVIRRLRCTRLIIRSVCERATTPTRIESSGYNIVRICVPCACYTRRSRARRIDNDDARIKRRGERVARKKLDGDVKYMRQRLADASLTFD